jgi:GxxExxY protein
MVPVAYKGRVLSRRFRIDLLLDGKIIVEAKAVENLHPAHFAQLLTYLRLADKPLGFLINFNAIPLGEGIHRRVNTRSYR